MPDERGGLVEKKVINGFLLLLIVMVAGFTWAIFKETNQPVVILIGVIIAIAIRGLMVKVDEMVMMPKTTEEKIITIQKQKKAAGKLREYIVPIVILFIIFSSGGGKALLKKLKQAFKEGIKQEKVIKKIKDGTYKEINKYGEKIEYTYKDGKLNGPYKIFYKDKNKLKEIWNYENDKLEGKSYMMYENGKVMKEQSYLNDKLHGWYKGYYSTGQIWERYYYENGVLKKKYVYSKSGEIIKPKK